MATFRVSVPRPFCLMAMAVCSLSLAGCPGAPSSSSGPSSGAKGLLEKVTTAYQKAKSYADAGELHVEIFEHGQSKGEILPIPMSVAFERPNKLRLDSFAVNVVCDGEQFWASVSSREFSDQVLYLKAPAELNLKQLYADPIVAQMITDQFDLRIPQLELLLANEPLKDLFGDVEEVKRLKDEPLYKKKDELPSEKKDESLSKKEESTCERLEVTGKDGKYVLWLDPKSHLLLRMEFPSAPLEKRFNPEAKLELRPWIDFQGARVNQPVPENAFVFEAPETANLLTRFVAPPPETPEPPSALLGKPAPPFEFKSLDGSPITNETLAGKVAVLDMWSVSCQPCFKSFPHLEKVYKKFQDNDRVAFLAVNTDNDKITSEALAETFRKMNLTFPIARDAEDPEDEKSAGSAFEVKYLPTTILLGPDGTIQGYEIGFVSSAVDALATKIERVLAGEDLVPETLERYEETQQRYQRNLAAFKKRLAEASAGVTRQIELPRAKIAERSEPEKFKLTRLWAAEGIKAPGNLLVYSDEAGAQRVAVLDGWRAVVELDEAGKTLARHELKIPEDAFIVQIRTAVDGEGNRYFVGFGGQEKRLFLFDREWKTLMSYPEETRSGIADVQLGDLNGDGKLELAVGYLGEVGVQGASLEGKRLWSNRAFDYVLSLALLDPDAAGYRTLLVTSERPALGVIDYAGERLPDVAVPDHPIAIIFAAQLNDEPRMELAAISALKPAELVALGLDYSGNVLWDYPLPLGVRTTPCDVMTSGRLSSENEGQWVITGPDSSIHILAADGNLVDKFNYGEELTGIGVANFAGTGVLLVSTAEELVAWKHEPAEEVAQREDESR